MNPLAGSRINPTTGLRTFDILEDVAAPDTLNSTRHEEIETPISGQQNAEFGLMHGSGKKVEEGRRFYDYPAGSMVAIKSPAFPHGEGEGESEGGAAFSEEKEVVIGVSSSRGGRGDMVDLKAQRKSDMSAISNDNGASPGRFEDGEIGNAITARRGGSVSQRRVSAITLDDEPYSYDDRTGNIIFGEGISASPTTYENGKGDGNGNANEPVLIAAARQARLNRPTVVDNRPSRLSAYFADGSRAGSVTAKVGSKLGLGLGGGGRGKAGKVLGEEVKEGNGERKRSVVEVYEDEDAAVVRNKDLLATLGVIASTAAGVPALAPAPAPLLTALEAEAEDTLPGLSYRENRKMSLMDALRSNPPDSRFAEFPKRAATAPTRRRKTTFVAPEPMDVRPGHLFLRQSIVNTPYPERDQEGEGEGEERRFSFPGEQREETEKARGNVVREKEGGKEEEVVLTVVLYSHGNPVPKLGKVVLPRSKQRRAISAEFPTTTNDLSAGSIDDEHLFTLLRDQYSRLRGFWHHLGSARRLQTISLLSFSHLSQLAARHERPVQLKTFRVVDDIFAEQRMLDLFRTPQRGRGQREWVDWVEGLPDNSHGGGGGEGEGTANGSGNGNGKAEKLALEFREGWSVGKIAGALAVVLAASLVAMLLWVFVGMSEEEHGGGYSNFGGERHREGAGGRVETGLVLGVLVLLLGWTLTGAWVLLSWLVM
ncbi:MAG: hypothetical protein Q9187_008475 [Circinaria calcarea]